MEFEFYQFSQVQQKLNSVILNFDFVESISVPATTRDPEALESTKNFGTAMRFLEAEDVARAVRYITKLTI